MNAVAEKKEAPGQNKTLTIVVNGREKTVEKDQIDYDEVVALAFPNPDFQNYFYKVTYFRNPDKGEHPHEGSLEKGQSTPVKEGMVFTVVPAIRS